MIKRILCGLTVEEIFRIIEPEGYFHSHAASITNALYKRKVTDLFQISTIQKKLKIQLDNSSVSGIYEPVASEISNDGTVKYLFKNSEGQKFETVYIPDGKRNTVCVSTQSGCRMGCPFCATGRYGFYGDLPAGDILNQILGIPISEKITHIVFMGMGEPMDNLRNVLKSCEIITAEWGMAVSPRNVTISTVGITPSIETFLDLSDCNLTLSLFSPFTEERLSMVPAERRYPVQNIIETMKNFPLKKKRRLTAAYVMIKDVNDTDRHLRGLKTMLKDSGIKVNLLSYHPVHDDINHSSTAERIQFFKHNLVISGISASVRKSRGADISAACGLLASGFVQESWPK
jgi:23S rRNA (adenine2503-C2)-methyltransferase